METVKVRRRDRAFQAEGIARAMVLWQKRYTCARYLESEGCVNMRKEVSRGKSILSSSCLSIG